MTAAKRRAPRDRHIVHVTAHERIFLSLYRAASPATRAIVDGIIYTSWPAQEARARRTLKQLDAQTLTRRALNAFLNGFKAQFPEAIHVVRKHAEGRAREAAR